MAFTPCSTECIILPPVYAQNSCDTIIESGGVANFVITSCDVPELTTLSGTPAENIALICDYIREGKIVISPNLLGEIPEADTESSDTESCSPATITGYTWNLGFSSFAHDPTNKSDYRFWNDLKLTYKKFRWYYMSCNGDLFGVVPSPSFSVSKFREQKNTQKAGWIGALSWQGTADLVPTNIPGLVEALNGGCADGDNGFTIDVEFASTLAGTAGGVAVNTDTLEVTRVGTCTEDIVVEVEAIEVFTGGPTPPTVTTVNIAGPAGTDSADIIVDPTNADAGIYDIVYSISACDDSETRVLRVTLT